MRNLWIVAPMLCKHVARKMATVEGRLFGLDVNKGYPAGMSILNKWTWHMTLMFCCPL